METMEELATHALMNSLYRNLEYVLMTKHKLISSFRHSHRIMLLPRVCAGFTASDQSLVERIW